jgi:inorganic triphosphatase YgiF
MDTLANREIELKLRFGQDDLPRIEALPELQAALGRADPHHVSTIYFDTPDQDLWKKGFSLRIRKTGERYTETIKQETASLIARGEWEKETNSATLDLAYAQTTPLAPLIGKRRVKIELRPVFEVNVERRVFRSNVNGAEIEGVIDNGHIEVDAKRICVRELELELKTGDPLALFDFARAITAQAPLQLCFLSKAERGFRLAVGSWGGSAKGSNPRLRADMTCREAFQEISRICLHDLTLNTDALDGSDYVEGVHQARVAIRRLRAALTLFKAMIRDEASETCSGELKWLAGLLGTARDLDVTQLETPAVSNGPAHEDVEAQRAAAHRAVREGIASPRYRAFLVDLVAWIEAGAWQARQADVAERPVADFVTKRLRKRRKQLVAAGADIEGQDPAARHRIRIDAKKLRYMSEFFLDVGEIATRRKAYKSFIGALEDLQEALGEMRDIEVRDAFHARALVTGVAEERGEPAAGYLEAAATDTSRQLARAIAAYERLVAAKPF